jgi:hypothetical protein
MKVTAGGKDTVGDMQRVIQSIPWTYTIWKDGTQTMAESNIKGGTDYTTGTDTVVIENALGACENGDSVFFHRPSTPYTLSSQIVITKGLSLEGAGVNNNAPATACPDDPPTALSGVVFNVSHNDDAFYVKDNVFNFRMAHMGFMLPATSTGAAVSLKSSADDWGTIYGELDDISVLNLGDGASFYLNNFQHLYCKRLRSWGGAFLYLSGIDASIDYGNSVFDECYAYVNKAIGATLLGIVTLVKYTGNRICLLQFNRLQVNAYANEKPVIKLHDADLVQFIGLDVESDHEYLVHAENSNWNTFVNPYFYGIHATSNVYIDANSKNNLFVGGHYNVNTFTGTDRSVVVSYPLFEPTNWVGACTIQRVPATGSSTGTGAQETHAHGLGRVPRNVTVTPNVTGATVTSIWADVTNVYCTVTNLKTYNWKAEP